MGDNINNNNYNNHGMQQNMNEQKRDDGAVQMQNFENNQRASFQTSPPFEPQQPEIQKMTDQEIADWHDHSTANKPRDFIGLNAMKQKQENAKVNTFNNDYNNNGNGQEQQKQAQK